MRRRGPPRTGGRRRLVRQRRDALRPMALPLRKPGALRRALPRRLHLRSGRSDARLVLLAARRSRAAAPRRGRPRTHLLPPRPLARTHPRRTGREDEQVARQCRGPLVRARRARCGCPALVLLRRLARRQPAPLLRAPRRRSAAPLPAHPLEHLRLLCHLRQHRRLAAVRLGRSRSGRAARPRPLDPQRTARDHPARHGGARRLRRHRRRARAGALRRRPQQLVRAPQPSPLLVLGARRRSRRSGCQGRRLRDALRRADHARPPARSPHALPGGGNLAQPRRRAGR